PQAVGGQLNRGRIRRLLGFELCGVLVGWEGLQWAAWYAKTALAAFFVVFRCLDIAPNVEVKTGQTT
ncbi:hypothetical protein, partial [uncultured Sutterella sp.]|uniref:hypothetical protein n=1 Tax=uncultured Sutterella sp. TaxID=286133 RepID=UPI00266F7677